MLNLTAWLEKIFFSSGMASKLFFMTPARNGFFNHDHRGSE
jgi:hypothetical protein